MYSVWWLLPYWLYGAGPVSKLHVILELEDGPHGKVIMHP